MHSAMRSSCSARSAAAAVDFAFFFSVLTSWQDVHQSTYLVLTSLARCESQ